MPSLTIQLSPVTTDDAPALADLRVEAMRESLKPLERWYFENGQPATTASGYSMPHAIAFYFGEVLCRTWQFRWLVQEYDFSKGHYEIGVQRQLLTIMLTKGRKLQAPGNKKMQSLWREVQKYAP